MRVTLFYALLLGACLAYFVTGVLGYFVSARSVGSSILIGCPASFRDRNEKGALAVKKIILERNILGALVEREKRRTVASVVTNKSTLAGYKLVGIVTGDVPMALFKKGSAPVEVVTPKEPLEKVWYLERIVGNRVVLKNGQTHERRSFVLEGVKTVEAGPSVPPAEEIGKVSLDKAFVLKEASDLNRLMTQIRLVPAFEGEEAVGYRVAWIDKRSILYKVGLRRGDVVISINGEPVKNVQRLLRMYAALKDMNSVSVELLRNGHLKTIFVELK